jgi:hypothetical protein
VRGVVGHHHPGDFAGELPGCVEIGVSAHGHHDVQPARTGGLDITREPEVVQCPGHRAGGCAHHGEVAVGRVEVEDQSVGVMQPVLPRLPHVQRDAVLIGQPSQRLRAFGHGMHHGAVLFGNLDTAKPFRQRIGEILLHEPLFADTAREPLHGERPALEMRQHRVGHLAVVVDQLALGDPVLSGGGGKHHPVRVGDLDRDAGHQ